MLHLEVLRCMLFSGPPSDVVSKSLELPSESLMLHLCLEMLRSKKVLRDSLSKDSCEGVVPNA